MQDHQRKTVLETHQRRTIVRGNDIAMSTESRGTERKTNGSTTTSKENKSKKRLQIHQQVPNRMANSHSAANPAPGKSKKPAPSQSQTSTKTTKCVQDAWIRGVPLSKGQSLIEGAPLKSPTATKKSPGKAKGKTNTAANPQVDVAFRAATSARCIKTGKSIAQKGNAVKKTKRTNKQIKEHQRSENSLKLVSQARGRPVGRRVGLAEM